MKRNFKRTLSLVLAVLMLISVVPMSGMAANCEDGNHDFENGTATQLSNGTHFFTCVNGDAISAVEPCYGGTATCQVKAICEGCNKEYGELGDHTFTAEVEDTKYLASDITCDQAATYYKSCAVCTLSSEGTTDEATFTGSENGSHAWGPWTNVEGENTHKRECTRENCDGIETGVCADAEPVVTNPTCASGGYTTYTCDTCGNVWTGDEKAALAHDYTEQIIDNAHLKSIATCQAAAVYFYDCANCDANAKDDENATGCTFAYGEAAAHTYTTYVYVEGSATCTMDGYEVAKCIYAEYGCAEEVRREAAGTATGHKAGDIIPGKDATCTQEGYTESSVCQNCGTELIKKEILEPLGHSEYVAIERQEATCTDAGHTEEKRCARCDFLMSIPSMPIPQTGHKDKDGDEVCDNGCGFLITDETCPGNCLCHSEGLIRIVYYIVLIFWRIFGMNKYCECGDMHY